MNVLQLIERLRAMPGHAEVLMRSDDDRQFSEPQEVKFVRDGDANEAGEYVLIRGA